MSRPIYAHDLDLLYQSKYFKRAFLKILTSELNEDSVSQVQVYEGVHFPFQRMSYTIIGIGMTHSFLSSNTSLVAPMMITSVREVMHLRGYAPDEIGCYEGITYLSYHSTKQQTVS